jgi:antitoxin CptB
MNNETHEARLKRMRMRSWRRGTKEMDMILGPYSDTELGRLTDEQLVAFDALLHENDQDLYQWVSGQMPCPNEHGPTIHLVQSFMKTRSH